MGFYLTLILFVVNVIVFLMVSGIQCLAHNSCDGKSHLADTGEVQFESLYFDFQILLNFLRKIREIEQKNLCSSLISDYFSPENVFFYPNQCQKALAVIPSFLIRITFTGSDFLVS